MPISQQEQEQREERRAQVETERATQAHEKYIKTLKEEIDVLAKMTKRTKEQQDTLDKLTVRVEESNKVHEEHKKLIREKIEDMGRENTALNRNLAGYKKFSDQMLVVAQAVNKSLTTYHSYNLEVQKIIDLTGRFTKSTQAGIDVFDKMRTELNLTRQAGVEFGKVFSDISRRGIDVSKFTEGAKQLQKAMGQAGGIAGMGMVTRAKVSTPTMEAAMGGDRTAMAKMMRSAPDLESAHAISRLTGGGGGMAGRSARFEREAARVGKVKDDIQAGMAAALDLGLGPEIGALALPLAEINANIAKLLVATIGNNGWLKTAISAGGGIGEKAGGVAATLAEGAEAVVPGGGMLAGAGKFLGKGAIAAALVAGGTYAHHLGEMAPEENTAFSKKGALTYGGRMAQGAGAGAAIGSVIPGLGTAAGALVGAGVGAVTAAYERNKKAVDDWTSETLNTANKWIQGMVLGEEAVKNIDYENSLLALKTNAEGAAASLEGMANEVANLPEMLELQIAQSRLPHALASMDPKPMEDYLEKASKAAGAAMLVSSSDLSKSMGELDAGIKGFDERAKAAGLQAEKAGTPEEKKKFEDEAKREREGARTGRAEKAKLEATMQEQMEKINLVPAAEKAMEGVEKRKGMRGLETRAAQVGFETKFAGTGNVEEMGKVQEQINTAYEANVADVEKGNAQAQAMYLQTVARVEEEKAGLAVDDSRRNVLQNMIDNAKDASMQRERTTKLELAELDQANQQTRIQTQLNQAMAATETIMFKRSQRAMALAKAQESFAREAGKGPEEIGRYAGAQAQEAGTQLNAFMDTFQKRMGELEGSKAVAKTDVERMSIEMKIKDLADERVKLETQNLQARMHAATAEERANQELIGANKRISEIQMNAAAKMGMSWQVQMKYQSDVIRSSREDLESTRKEMAGMADEIKRAGGDPAKNAEYMKKQGDMAEKEANLISTVMGKQRSFLEQSLANSFGIGGGSRISPLISNRMFGEQFQNVTGQRQAVGPGQRPLTMQEQRAKRLRDAFGGEINAGVPAPGGAPGLAPGEAIPPAAGKPGAAGAAPGQAAAGQRPAFDVSGDVKVVVVMDTPIFKTEVTKILAAELKGAGLPGAMRG